MHRLSLTHHDPGRDDDGVDAIEARARELFPGAVAARKGLELALDRKPMDMEADLAALAP